MSTAAAFKNVDFGTWGVWELRQPVAAKPTPPRNPTPIAPTPTLTLLPKRKPVYAVGERLAIQHPACAERVVAEATVIARYHAADRGDRRRISFGSYWLYGVIVNGEDWLLNESALSEAEVDARKPVLSECPKSATTLAS